MVNLERAPKVQKYKIVSQLQDGVMLHQDHAEETDDFTDYIEVANNSEVTRVSSEIRTFGNRRWYKVYFNGKAGWIASSYLRDSKTVGNWDQIDCLLKEMDGFGQASLRRSHTSLLYSFEQMLAFSKKISTAGMPEDIYFLLDIYREMAERFYTQFELSFLEKIKSSQNQHNEADKALIEKFPLHLQSALDKLRDEWLRVSTIALASQALVEDEDLIKTLELVVNAAAYFVGVEAERITVVPGEKFGLYFFSYVDNFAVLTVPIYSVQAPWEWSIFWHELAGYKVRRLENDFRLESIKKNLNHLHKRYKKLSQEEKQTFLNTLFLDNLFCQNYLNSILSSPKVDLSELGGFDHQFNQMLSALSGEDRQKALKGAGDLVWSVDWFKELFEDAWSVLAIGDKFLPLLKEILERHADINDWRHPPLDVRLRVAHWMLSLTQTYVDNLSSAQTMEMRDPLPIEKKAVEQILKFISLLKAGTLKVEDQDITKWEFLNDPRKKLFEEMKIAIQVAIDFWNMQSSKTGKIPEEDYAQTARYGQEFSTVDGVKNFLESVSDLICFKKANNEYPTSIKNQLIASYAEILDGKDYEELLSLSFYDIDFLLIGGIGTKVYNYRRMGERTVNPGPFKLKQAINVNAGPAEILFSTDRSDTARYGTTRAEWKKASKP